MSTLKYYKPTTPARRRTSVVNYAGILTRSEPYKPLTNNKRKINGRNRDGKITVRHRGGGSKRLYREIDFKHNFQQGFKVESIEYDPNRSAFICLVVDLKSGKRSYILHTQGLEAGKVYGKSQDQQNGVTTTLKDALLGSLVSQIEISPKSGAKIVRSAGCYAQVTAKEEKYVTLRLPSGEVRKFLETCTCVVGRIGNEVHEQVRVGKAGRVRHSGFRPTVRGKVMNPVDHPHGGGEARNSIGMKYPKTPWGKHALGVRTRKKNKQSDRLIVSKRK